MAQLLHFHQMPDNIFKGDLSSWRNTSSGRGYTINEQLILLPVITVGEFHVHAMTAQEGLAVQWNIGVGRMLNGLTH